MVTPLTLSSLGMGDAAVKYVAEHWVRGETAIAAKYFQTTLTMALLIGVAGALLLGLVGPILSNKLFGFETLPAGEVTASFWLVGSGWLFTQASSVFSGVPKALQRYEFVAGASTLLSLAGSLFGILFVVLGWGLVGYVGATILAAFIVMLFNIAVVWRLAGVEFLLPRLDPYRLSHCMHFGVWQTVGNIGGLAALQSERYLLAAFLSPSAVGVYNVAWRLEQVAYVVVAKLAEVLFPAYSSLSDAPLGQRAGMVLRSSWILTSLSVCALAPLVVLASPALRIWMGEEIALEGTPVLQALALGGILGSATNSSYYYLLGMGKTKWTALVSLATGAATIVVALAVLPKYGLVAAGWSGVAAMLVQIVAVSSMLRVVFGRHCSPGAIFVFLYSPVVIGLATIFMFWIVWVPACKTWLDLIACYGVVAASTALAIFLSNFILPGRDERTKDIRRICVAMLPQRFNSIR